MKKETGPTEKQQRFVEEFFIDYNATQAYIRAGYSKAGATTSASRLLANAHIQEAIAERAAYLQQEVQVDQNFVIGGFKEIYLDVEASNQDRLRALENLAKFLRLYDSDVDPEQAKEISFHVHYHGEKKQENDNIGKIQERYRLDERERDPIVIENEVHES